MVIWNWLVSQGLFHDLVSAMVLVPIMRIAASRPLKRFENAVKRMESAVKRYENAIERDVNRVR